MINIVCLKWGGKYGPEYVNRLFYALRRNTTRDYQFWCLTEQHQGIDIQSGIKILPLKYPDRLDSWWNKISLFDIDNGLPVNEQIFYIDLDTLIVDNIDDLLTEEVPDIIMLKDFYHGIAKTAGTVGSGLMSWRHGDYSRIWLNFIKDPKSAIKLVHPHGDQHWIETQINAWYFWQDLFPDAVVSFKVHCGNGLPPGAKIVCYHGKPNIPDSAVHDTRDYKWKFGPQSWVLDHWRDE